MLCPSVMSGLCIRELGRRGYIYILRALGGDLVRLLLSIVSLVVALLAFEVL